MTTPPDGPAPDIRILFVDDDPDFLDLVEIFVGDRHAELTVETATSAAAVPDRLADDGIDCIVSDYRMPGMDGLDLLAAVRERLPDLPFILFTGKGGEEIAAEAVSAGVTDYIRKSTDPDQFGLLANRVRNVVERHRARVQYQAVFDSVSEAILVIDAASGTVTDANRRASELWGHPPEALVGMAVDDLREGDQADPPNVDTAPGSADETADETAAEWHCVTRDGRRFWGAISRREAEIDGRAQLLVIVRDVTRRKVRQRQLDGLLDTVRELLVEGSEGGIADAVETTAVEVLRFGDAVVHLLGDDGRRFRAVTDGDAPDPAEEDEFLWDALDAGELVVATEATDRGGDDESAVADAGGTGFRATRRASDSGVEGRLYVPLGDGGVLRCTPSRRSDAHDVDLLELLATFAAGAFDRARREALLRDQEETVRQHRDELLALNHVNEVIRDINQALVSVSSREGIERLVCEKFVATDRYQFAWVGTYESGDHVVVPTARAGRGEGFLPERIELDPDGSSSMARAATEQAVTVIDRITPEAIGEDRYRLARERGFRSVAYVPVVHQSVLYRLVAVYADEPGAFGERERAVLGELGETIGLAMAAAEWRSARISETAVELELAIESRRGLFALTADGAVAIQLTDLEETGAGALQVFARVTGTTFEAFERAVADVPSLDDARQLGADADGIRVVFSVRSGPLLNAVTTAGIALDHATIAEGAGRFGLTVPTGTDVRWVVDQFQAAFESVELVGRRDRYRRDRSRARETALAVLTDRQQEALRVAYHAGYFDRPRKATGEAVAEILGISQPTFNEHLRNAEHRLFEQLLRSDGPAAGEQPS